MTRVRKGNRAILPVNVPLEMQHRLDEVLETLIVLRRKKHSYIHGTLSRAVIMRYLMELGMERFWVTMLTRHGLQPTISPPEKEPEERVRIPYGRITGRSPEPDEPILSTGEDLFVFTDNVVSTDHVDSGGLINVGARTTRAPRKNRKANDKRKARKDESRNPDDGGSSG